jgi:hypothetical protein
LICKISARQYVDTNPENDGQEFDGVSKSSNTPIKTHIFSSVQVFSQHTAFLGQNQDQRNHQFLWSWGFIWLCQ